MLSKTRTLIKTLTLTPKSHPITKSITTLPFLNQEPQFAIDPHDPPHQNPTTPSPLPPNPATGSPLYHENWRSHISTTSSAIIPLALIGGVARPEAVDAAEMLNLFGKKTAAGEWGDLKGLFEGWVRELDRDGKPNRPTVEMWNHYLWANLMRGASAADLLDVVAQMEDYAVEPNTASFNVVLRALFMAVEAEAAEKLLQRMLQSGKGSLPDAESYGLVIPLLLQQDKIEDALKFIDLALKSGHPLTMNIFTECVRTCVTKRRVDTLVSIIERCKTMDQNKALCPTWNMCNMLAQFAIQNDSSELAFSSLEFMAKLISRGENLSPKIYYSTDEGLIVSILATAGRTCNPKLLEASWQILRLSLGKKKAPNPETFLAKIYAYSSLGNLLSAFRTLNEFETAHANTATEAGDELFSPFSSLYPLVVACCKENFESLDMVYFQLESLSRGEVPYKSVAALNCIILGCANIWDIDRAYQTFEAIGSTFGLTPNIHSYNALMYAFGKLKKTSEAVKVLEHSISLGVKPNAMSYSLLADAHLINRDPKSALSVLDEMVDVGFIPSRVTLKKIRRRCIREMDYDSNNRLDSLAKRLKIPLGSENRRDILFSLEYATEYAI
ncbi:hypothetical protein Drorol1_Dr00003468 [Drosera rotundifolia]